MAKKKLTPEKAREMLHNPPHGKPLTEKQRKYFGAISNMQLGGFVYPVNYVPQKKDGGWLDEFEDAPKAQFGINSFPTNFLIEKAASLFGGNKYSRPDEIDIKDLRKIRKTTNKKIDPNSDLVSGKYDTGLIGEMLEQAKEFGISKEDAWNLAAIGLQESGWGKTDENLGHVLGDVSQGDTEHPFINAYLNKMRDADRLKIKNPELRLQVYNGLGVVKPETEENYHGFKMKKIYGVPVPKEGINMKKTPLYGRQIIDIRDNVLKKNPEVVKFVDSYYPEEKQYGGSVESHMGGLTDKGFNYNGAWGGPSMQMGGTMPGSVGFTYARTINPAPSEGPYAKKTMASAQNGMEMKFYQEGLDWTPKNISRDGSEIPQAQFGMGLLPTFDQYQKFAENVGEILSAPQKAITSLFSGKYQTPSEAMNIKNPVGALATDIILDPINLMGAGAAGKVNKAIKASKESGALSKVLSKVYKPKPKPTSISASAESIKPSFQSEIDWAKWNSDTPKYPELINEYNAIEESTKKAGTWMKNPDGTAFAGTPEQFIQQQSSWFKKAFPDGFNTTYRGANNNATFRGNLALSDNPNLGAVFAGNKNSAVPKYGSFDRVIRPDELGKSHQGTPGYMQLAYKPSSNNVGFTAKMSNWDNIDRSLLPIEHRNMKAATQVARENPSIVTTDDIARHIQDKDLDYAKIENINDGTFFGEEIIYNHKPNNYLKSLWHNVGFFDMTNPNIYKGLVPTILGGAAAASIDKKKKGGKIKKDDNGYWNPENWGKPVEIGSNEITMQGVDQPLLGVSDTGDTQMMYPGEDYRFDGKTVTEYPVAQKGINVPAPTTADSLLLYNNQLLKDAFYKNSGKYKSLSPGTSNKDIPDIIRQLNLEKNDGYNYEHLNNEFKTRKKFTNENLSSRFGKVSNIIYSSGDILNHIPDKWFNPEAPPSFFSNVIKPQSWVAYGSKDFSDASDVPMYDPLAVKPYNMRTPQEKIEWEKKYGKPKPKPKPSVKPEPKKEVVKKQEPTPPSPIKKTEQPKPVERKQNVYEGTPVYSSNVGSGMPSAVIGFANQRGDTTYIKPEDYERFGVPKYGKEYIESKTTNKKKNGGWLDEFE